MVTEYILFLETSEPGCIHLVRDRLFWQAWERSAFLFVRLLRPYQVHCKFVQKVNQDLSPLRMESSNDNSSNVQKDHVHQVFEIPPNQSVSFVVGFLKGQSAIKIFDRHKEACPYLNTLLDNEYVQKTNTLHKHP
jgi:hypothetical protein